MSEIIEGKEILDKIEQLVGSNCSMHSDVWTGFTLQLNKLTLETDQHRSELAELKENSRDMRSLTATIQEQNFRIDKMLEDSKERKKENDSIFRKLRAHDDQFNEIGKNCPLEKQKIESELYNVSMSVVRLDTKATEERDTLKKTLEESIDDKIKGVSTGQNLFRWLVATFLVISISITGYNIDRTIDLTHSVQSLKIDCEKSKQADTYMRSTITKNAEDIHDLLNKE